MGSIPMELSLSSPEDSAASPSETVDMPISQPAKRTATDAGLRPNGTRPAKSVKRRASKACQCCRSRKVRCNVVEHGPPCTNCRLDEVECIVSESKRKKKWTTTGAEASPQQNKGLAFKPTSAFPMSAQPPYEPMRRASEHVPHTVYQDIGRDIALSSRSRSSSMYAPDMLALHRLGPNPSTSDPSPFMNSINSPTSPLHSLPLYIKPLPTKLEPEDLAYLERRGALTIPPTTLRNELLRNYVEFVYPSMPMLNIHDLVATIDRNDGIQPISLLLFQAIMFSAVATIDMRFLTAAGYSTRRDARRDFFRKTRLLYDFDVEIDRISLIQSLLMMTYWYETPDDQKDSHHWMGIAVSLSHTIGLHRNPDKSPAMDPARKKLWKRIWWSTYLRDRQVALGMRRPTRIKDADFDVPMLEVGDFDVALLPEGDSCIPADCKVLRDLDSQKQLAQMCMQTAKLSICMSHVLSVQYSVLNNNHGVVDEEGSSRTTVRLVARQLNPEVNEVQTCDKELQEWHDALPSEAQYVSPTWSDVDTGNRSVVLHRSLLHLMYYAALSALHRPQVLPSTAVAPRRLQSELLEHSRKTVRLAATEITRIAYQLYTLDMARFFPSTGITVLLPAIIIHLLDIKAPDESTRRHSLQGFCQCMQIMGKLRDIYAAADYSTAFLEAAIRKAEITLPQKADEVKEPRNVITSAQGLVDAGRRMQLVASAPPEQHGGALTPPPDSEGKMSSSLQQKDLDAQLTDNDIARRLSVYLASTPPDSEGHHVPGGDSGEEGSGMGGGEEGQGGLMMHHHPEEDVLMDGHGVGGGGGGGGVECEPDFDSLINLDAAGDVWSLEDGAYAAMGGESGGFTMDMDWMKGMRDDGLEAAAAGGGDAGEGRMKMIDLKGNEKENDCG